jgi:hypothetical protein
MWLHAHLGPIPVLSFYEWQEWVLTLFASMLLVIPIALFKRHPRFAPVCTTGFFLWLLLGFETLSEV